MKLLGRHRTSPIAKRLPGMAFLTSNPRDRIASAIATVLIEGLFLYIVLIGLTVGFPAQRTNDVDTFALLPPPPPPAPRRIPQHAKKSHREGAASPPNLRSKATPVIAPTPQVVLPLPPPPIAATPKPAVGSDRMSGASNRIGPGVGSGGIGNGTGSGGAGDGDGDGGELPPRWRSGRIRDSDYPSFLADAQVQGTVGLRYVVLTNGRVGDCRVTRSSGSAELDALTCRLVQQRFRFDPSRDADGDPVESIIVENHSWLIEEPPEPPPAPRKRGW